MPHANLAARRAYLRQWKKRNSAKVAEYARRDHAKNPDRVRRHSLAYRKRNLEQVRETQKLKARERRALRPEVAAAIAGRAKEKRRRRQIELAGREPPAVCELCGEFHLRIVWDHDHASGKFRAWLCDRCNKVLGLVYESRTLLQKLGEYLEAHSSKTPGDAQE